MALSPVELSNAATSKPGSIADVAARLTLWGRHAPKGLARVEFDSEYSRQAVVVEIRSRLADADIPFHEIKLPLFTSAPQIVLYLKEQFAVLPPGVVSISGWATAFSPNVSLEHSLGILNYNRENITNYPLCQIWWLTRPFADTVIRTIRDLNSWFIVRLDLKEAIVQLSDKGLLELTPSPLSSLETSTLLESAKSQSAAFTARLERAIATKSDVDVFVVLATISVTQVYGLQPEQESLQLAETLLDQIITGLLLREPYKKYKRTAFYEISTWKTTTGYQGSHLASTLDALAFLYSVAGRLQEAESFYRAALDLELAHIKTYGMYANLAITGLISVLHIQKRYDEAAAYCESLMATLEKIRNVNRLFFADIYLLLGKTQFSQEKYAEAEAAFIKALVIQNTQSANTLPEAFLIRSCLASLYRTLGRVEEMQKYEQQTIALQLSISQNVENEMNDFVAKLETRPKPSEIA